MSVTFFAAGGPATFGDAGQVECRKNGKEFVGRFGSHPLAYELYRMLRNERCEGVEICVGGQWQRVWRVTWREEKRDA